MTDETTKLKATTNWKNTSVFEEEDKIVAPFIWAVMLIDIGLFLYLGFKNVDFPYMMLAILNFIIIFFLYHGGITVRFEK